MAENHPMLPCLLDPSFGIPTDVTFQIMGLEDIDNQNGKEKEVMLGEVHGHKIILGLFSPVFKRGFFGPAKESKDVIPVRQTTLEAFRLLVDYIYSKDINWKCSTLLELYDVVNLAEKYDIPKLMEKLQTQVKKVPVEMENVMEVANTANQFTQFPEVSSALMIRCAEVIKQSLKTSEKLLQFATDQSGTGNEELVLKLMTTIKLSKAPCENCRQEECQNGKSIETSDQFYVGCQVSISKDSLNYWNPYGYREDQDQVYKYAYTVKKLHQNTGGNTVGTNITNNENGAKYRMYLFYQNCHTFCYKCDSNV